MRRPRSAGPALYGIIGHPLAHTLSPAMQQAAFRALRLRARYLPFEVPPQRLRHAVHLLRRLGVAGFNVTVPHKERIARWLDGVDATARAIGAVNTVVRREGCLIGYNTDAAGLLAAWRQARIRVRGTTVLVLGAGGAARAVLWALDRAGARRVALANRSRRRAATLQRWCRRTLPRLQLQSVTWAQRQAWLVAHRPRLMINATSLGLHVRDPLPISPRAVPRGTVAYDLTYRRPTTTWVARLRRRGLLAFDGRSMLLYQGAQALTLWTGRRPPVSTMARALQLRVR